MSTNAIISIKNSPISIYKHWDGHPEATLEWLETFNKEFCQARGVDPEYKLAALLRSSAFDAEKFNLDDSKFTGWGILPPNSNWGFDYKYILLDSGKVKVIKG